MIITITLNGTGENPYHKMGLKQNPFPQIAKYEYRHFDAILNNLAAEPIKDAAHLRERLKGCSEEFIEECVRHFKPGEKTEFKIRLEDK